MVKIKILFALLTGFALSGCELFEDRGDISLSIAATDGVDLPGERFEEVVIAVSKIVFVSAGGDRETIEFDPAEQLNLLEYTRGDSGPLISVTTLPSGRYESIELTIDSEEDDSPSYIGYRDSSEFADLFVPDDQQSKLKIPIDFEIEDGEVTALTLQLELRKSLQRQSFNFYELHPSVRALRDDEIGSIAGKVDSSLTPTGCNAAVYAFVGGSASIDDIDETGVGPIITAAVFQNDARDGLIYSLDFLEAGTYRLAMTCKAGDEDPTTDDDLDFFAETQASVKAGDMTELDITD